MNHIYSIFPPPAFTKLRWAIARYPGTKKDLEGILKKYLEGALVVLLLGHGLEVGIPARLGRLVAVSHTRATHELLPAHPPVWARVPV